MGLALIFTRKNKAMHRKWRIRPALLSGALLLAGFGLAAPAPALAPELAMLAKVKPGLWELHEIGQKNGRERICINDTRKLLQIRHRQLTCSRFIIDDRPTTVTVSYRCPGGNHGRTTIKHESDTLLRITSQGIDTGSPFSFDDEARHVGSC